MSMDHHDLINRTIDWFSPVRLFTLSLIFLLLALCAVQTARHEGLKI